MYWQSEGKVSESRGFLRFCALPSLMSGEYTKENLGSYVYLFLLM